MSVCFSFSVFFFCILSPGLMRVSGFFWRVPLTVSMVPELHVHILKERAFVFFNCGVEPEPPQRNSLHLPMSFSTVLYPTNYFFSRLYVVLLGVL
jgi:hypothetical protein